MKIVDRKTFLAMPAGVVYSKYEPCCFGPLEIKGDSCGDIDFFSQQIADSVKCGGSDEFADILFDAAETGASFALDFEIEGRDGCFDAGQLFAVWESEDVSALVARLQKLMSNVESERGEPR